ncbi:hypothetical protein B0T17DRAFT_515978 [Bombardia bombarda]|uniref:Uncharacterized protein n=1 Tax=Bombardia bombarda TaxID=252184 RepID=A0AA40CFD9_9PEZI|nr:hypothetical protein B0T17DRAFT_515978 [Bombardia bombarda]
MTHCLPCMRNRATESKCARRIPSRQASVEPGEISVPHLGADAARAHKPQSIRR